MSLKEITSFDYIKTAEEVFFGSLAIYLNRPITLRLHLTMGLRFRSIYLDRTCLDYI